MKNDCLPRLEDSKWKPKYFKPKIVWVHVKDIVGVANNGYLQYNPDWTPKRKGNRWQNIYNAIKSGMRIEDLGGDLDPISLYRTPDGKFWVYEDGNHRISVANALGIKRVPAEVRYLVPKE